jgi:hypothetical protein
MAEPQQRRKTSSVFVTPNQPTRHRSLTENARQAKRASIPFRASSSKAFASVLRLIKNPARPSVGDRRLPLASKPPPNSAASDECRRSRRC